MLSYCSSYRMFCNVYCRVMSQCLRYWQLQFNSYVVSYFFFSSFFSCSPQHSDICSSEYVCLFFVVTSLLSFQASCEMSNALLSSSHLAFNISRKCQIPPVVFPHYVTQIFRLSLSHSKYMCRQSLLSGRRHCIIRILLVNRISLASDFFKYE